MLKNSMLITDSREILAFDFIAWLKVNLYLYSAVKLFSEKRAIFKFQQFSHMKYGNNH